MGNFSQKIRKFLAAGLSLLLLLTVTLREIHYIFSQEHKAGEKCENHLHGKENCGDCSLCKTDILFFTDEITFPEISPGYFPCRNIALPGCAVISATELSQQFLRGPPLNS